MASILMWLRDKLSRAQLLEGKKVIKVETNDSWIVIRPIENFEFERVAEQMNPNPFGFHPSLHREGHKLKGQSKVPSDNQLLIRLYDCNRAPFIIEIELRLCSESTVRGIK